MEFDYRQRRIAIIIIVALGLLLAIGAGVWWINGRTRTDLMSVATEKPSEILPPAITEPLTPTRTPVSPPVSEDQIEVVGVARLFTERFGTFSSHENFQGVRELAVFMTPSFSRWVNDNYLPNLEEKYPAGEYAGETTKALSTSVTSLDERAATVDVRTQLVTATPAGRETIRYRTLSLELVKQGNKWLVDAAYWGALQ